MKRIYLLQIAICCLFAYGIGSQASPTLAATRIVKTTQPTFWQKIRKKLPTIHPARSKPPKTPAASLKANKLTAWQKARVNALRRNASQPKSLAPPPSQAVDAAKRTTWQKFSDHFLYGQPTLSPKYWDTDYRGMITRLHNYHNFEKKIGIGAVAVLGAATAGLAGLGIAGTLDRDIALLSGGVTLLATGIGAAFLRRDIKAIRHFRSELGRLNKGLPPPPMAKAANTSGKGVKSFFRDHLLWLLPSRSPKNLGNTYKSLVGRYARYHTNEKNLGMAITGLGAIAFGYSYFIADQKEIGLTGGSLALLWGAHLVFKHRSASKFLNQRHASLKQGTKAMPPHVKAPLKAPNLSNPVPLRNTVAQPNRIP